MSEGQWVPPWREGLRQARCRNPDCNPKDAFGRPYGRPQLVVAMTMVDGLCVTCAAKVRQLQTTLALDA